MSTSLRHRVLGLNRLGIPSTALAAVTLGLAAALLEAAEPASAAFAGPNGRIAFASDRDGDDDVRGEDGDDIVNTQDTVQGNDIADGGQGTGDSCTTDPGDRR